MAGLLDALSQTWPAKMGQGILDAVQLPGQVAGGLLAAQPSQPGMWSDVDEARQQATQGTMMNRATDLAGLVMGGSYAAAPAMKNASGMGIRAYHGSPHDFDRFDLSKIGTGEGAQAYGHGLYFAEKEATAKAYRDAVSAAHTPANKVDLNANGYLVRAGMDKDAAISMMEKDLGGRAPQKHIDYLRGQIRDYQDVRIPGRMYEVNINARPEQFLDWDKPLSGQSDAVRSAVESAIGPTEISKSNVSWSGDLLKAGSKILAEFPAGKVPDDPLGHVRGMNVPRLLSPNPAAQSDALRDLGIPGIKYLDQGSRGAPDFMVRADGDKFYVAGNGLNKYAGPFDSREAANAAREAASEQFTTRNYVVFDDSLIDILRKYGLVGGAAAGAMYQGNEAQAAP